MTDRTEFEMTDDDLAKLMDAMKPVPLIMLQCGTRASPQERANAAWAELGRKMGFNPMTVKPPSGKGPKFFTAERATK